MWRLLLVVVAVGLGLAACGEDEVDVEEFGRRLKALQDGTFTVTYVMETTSNLETEVRDLVWYRGDRDPNYPLRPERVDLSGDFGFSIRIGAPISYNCGQAEGAEGEPLCGVDGRRVSEPDHWFMRPASIRDSVEVVDSRGKTIAGLDAECYELEVDSFAVPYSTLEMCLSEEGLLLLGRTGPIQSPDPEVEGMVISMTAVEATTEVAADAFEPPYPVID